MRTAVLGATGYAGLTLLQWLARHPEFRVVAAVSEHAADRPLADVLFPHPRLPERFTSPAAFDDLATAEVVFSALGPGRGLDRLRRLAEAGAKIVDLSANFRFARLETFEQYYGPHPDPELHRRSFTGYADDDSLIYPQKALLGNPGCYPTAFAVAVLPLVRRWGSLGYAIVDGKSGVSGAGRAASVELLMAEMQENVEAYNQPGQHRHTGEMECVSGGTVVFQPHRVPMRQGILLTIYLPQAPAAAAAIRQSWLAAYADNPFVVVAADAGKPRTATVRDTNAVALAVDQDARSGTVVIYSAIDNLVKGAAGQAIQHANRWIGLPCTAGLL